MPGELRTVIKKKIPTLRLGDIELNAEIFEKLKPEQVLTIARALVDPEVAGRESKTIAELSKDLLPKTGKSEVKNQTAILITIDEIIKRKKWPREVAIEVDGTGIQVCLFYQKRRGRTGRRRLVAGP